MSSRANYVFGLISTRMETSVNLDSAETMLNARGIPSGYTSRELMQKVIGNDRHIVLRSLPLLSSTFCRDILISNMHAYRNQIMLMSMSGYSTYMYIRAYGPDYENLDGYGIIQARFGNPYSPPICVSTSPGELKLLIRVSSDFRTADISAALLYAKLWNKVGVEPRGYYIDELFDYAEKIQGVHTDETSIEHAMDAEGVAALAVYFLASAEGVDRNPYAVVGPSVFLRYLSVAAWENILSELSERHLGIVEKALRHYASDPCDHLKIALNNLKIATAASNLKKGD